MPPINVRALALERLSWALTASVACQLLESVLAELQLPGIDTVDDLRAVGQALQRRPGDSAWLGSLLVLHSAALETRAPALPRR